MSICKRIARALGTLIILWSVAACAAQSPEITDVSGASDADAETVAVSKPVAAVSEGASGPAGGRTDEIKVHGHWTIEIRDPDGTLVSHREFENALLTSGQSIFASIIGRNRVMGRWAIEADGAPSPCGGFCIVAESTDPQTGTNVFKNLTVTPTGVGGPPRLILSGNATASADGSITIVGTSNQPCATSNQPGPAACTTAPLDSTGAQLFQITSTTLTSPIAVLNGQQIQLQVVLTFS